MNNKEQNTMIEHRNHFSIRKLSIGAASVLIATSLYFGAATLNSNLVSAETQEPATAETAKTPTTTEENAKVTEHDKNNDPESSATSQRPASNKPADSNNTTTNGQDAAKQYEPDAQHLLKYRKEFGLEEPDALTDQQLKDMGIDRKTYLHDGVKYKGFGHTTVTLSNGQTIDLGDYQPYHLKNGDIDIDFLMKFMPITLDDPKSNITVSTIDDEVRLAPYINGGTIYIQKGHTLDQNDLNRAIATLPQEFAAGFKDVTWDSNISKVDVNKIGTYDASLDVIYKNDLGVSAGIKVVVQEPEQPTTPSVPIVDPTPTPDPQPQPTAPTEPTNVEPKPEQPEVEPNDTETVKPHATDTDDVKKPAAKASKKANKVTKKSAEKSVAPKATQTVKANVKAQLPQTGEKQNKLSLIGLAFASIAGLFGIAANRKRKN